MLDFKHLHFEEQRLSLEQYEIRGIVSANTRVIINTQAITGTDFTEARRIGKEQISKELFALVYGDLFRQLKTIRRMADLVDTIEPNIIMGKLKVQLENLIAEVQACAF